MRDKMNVWDVLKSPVITEKSVLLKEQSTDDEEQGQVLTFRVSRKASKDDIRIAVEDVFGVKVAKIRTLNRQGKMKRQGRHEGRRAAWKKAYITLKPGEPHVDYAEAI